MGDKNLNTGRCHMFSGAHHQMRNEKSCVCVLSRKTVFV